MIKNIYAFERSLLRELTWDIIIIVFYYFILFTK